MCCRPHKVHVSRSIFHALRAKAMKEIACDGYEKRDLKRLFGLTPRALTSLVAQSAANAINQAEQLWNEQLSSSPARQKSEQRVLCLPENRLRRASETLKAHLQPHKELTSYQI